jgi:hypothetical protein
MRAQGDGADEMPGTQPQLMETTARHFVLTTVWQGLSELADHINAETDRVATLVVDPAVPLGQVSLCVYPVGSQPAQATPIFRYDVTVRSAASDVRVQFVAQPAVVNGQLRSREQGALAIPETENMEWSAMTPHDVRDDVERRYQAAVEVWKTRGKD